MASMLESTCRWIEIRWDSASREWFVRQGPIIQSNRPPETQRRLIQARQAR